MADSLVPRVAQIIMNTTFRMFPDSSAAKGAKPGDKAVKQQLSPEAMAMQQMRFVGPRLFLAALAIHLFRAPLMQEASQQDRMASA